LAQAGAKNTATGFGVLLDLVEKQMPATQAR